MYSVMISELESNCHAAGEELPSDCLASARTGKAGSTGVVISEQ
jgi:hypothetical protein